MKVTSVLMPKLACVLVHRSRNITLHYITLYYIILVILLLGTLTSTTVHTKQKICVIFVRTSYYIKGLLLDTQCSLLILDAT